jgi:hypothetical protein
MVVASVTVPIGRVLKWSEVVAFVELGEALGMDPGDEVRLEYDDVGDQFNGLMMFVDPSLIETGRP